MKLTAEQYAQAKHAGIRAANHELDELEQIFYTVVKFADAMKHAHDEGTRRILECAMYDHEQNN